MSALVLALTAHAGAEPAAPSPVRGGTAGGSDHSDAAWFEGKVSPCLDRLRRTLDAHGYSHLVVLDLDLRVRSIVDEAEARAAASGADVVLLTNGAQMHAVAPFLSFSRSRSLVRQSEAIGDRQDQRVCVFARAVGADAELRRSQRRTLGAIGVLAIVLSLALVALARRRAAAEVSPPRPG